MCNDISDASSGRLRDASTLTSSSSLDHLFSFSAYLDARLSESALRARVMARKSLTYTTLIIILLYSTLLMSLKRTAPNDLENYAQHSHASTHGYPCTPKRPRTSYDPLSPSRYHTNPAHYPAQNTRAWTPWMGARPLLLATTFRNLRGRMYFRFRIRCVSSKCSRQLPLTNLCRLRVLYPP
jgi:hypothetical protein